MNFKKILFITGTTFLLASCTGDETPEVVQMDEEEMLVERVRPAQEGGTTAAYFTYTNNLETSDTLLSISSSVAGMAQVHETYATEDDMTGMREPENLVVSPGDSITFRQGGFHVMLMQLEEHLQVGDTVVIELEFTQKGIVEKRILVRTY